MNDLTRTPSRASTLASQDSKISNAQYAALSGATKAFGRPTLPQKASTNTTLDDNGALAAAVTVGSRPSSPHGRRYARSPARPLVASPTGGSVQSAQGDSLHSGQIPHLQPPRHQMRQQHSKSPSLQAASLAAARASPQPQSTPYQRPAGLEPASQSAVARRPAAPPKPRELSGQHVHSPADAANHPTDETSIRPTTSLVNLFEQKNTQSPPKRPQPIVIKPSTDLAIRSPQPLRSSGGGLTSVFQIKLPEDSKPSSPEQGVRNVRSPGSSADSFASASEIATAPGSPTNFMNDRGATSRKASTTNDADYSSSLSERRVPSPPPVRSSSANPTSIAQPPSRSVTASSDRRSPSSASMRSIPAQFNMLYPRGKAPQMTGDQLANAMVASSLASSRIASPQRRSPPPVPSRRPKHHTFGFSRTPSPSRGGMKHTLRKTESESDSDDSDELHPYGKHRRKRHLRKHPNKHHEGDRKRWRDAVTERERKRYEGVWAANKGIYCSLTPSEQALLSRSSVSAEVRALQSDIGDQISNIVARDIWQRSRLPDSTLETVWDLVDNDRVGRLTKDEFVVAMFLIDYCLKGRKLPIKVSESVWASVRGLQGIKIRKK